MSSVVIAGNTSGTVTLDAPNVAGTTVLTLPTTSGTIITNTAGTVTQTMLANGVAGKGPAFSVFVPSTLTITSAVGTKVAFSSETFDTASCFNNTGSTVGSIPAYAFLPNVAGYYQFNVSINLEAGVSPSRALITLVKNNVANKRVADVSPNPLNAVNGSALIYMNGTTDYIHVEAYITASTARMTGDANGELTYFNGCLVRAA